MKIIAILAVLLTATLSLSAGSGGGSHSVNAAISFDNQARAAGVEQTSAEFAMVAILAEGVEEIGWSNFVAAYPFVGSGATGAALNMIEPTTREITWGGAPTFNSAGVTGNGSNAYGTFGYTLADVMGGAPGYTGTLGLYSRTELGSTSKYETASANGPQQSLIRLNASNQRWYGAGTNNNSADYVVVSSPASTKGIFIASRTGANILKGYHNGLQEGSTQTSSAAGWTGSGRELVILAQRQGAGGIANFSAVNMGFFFLAHIGLNDSQAAAFSAKIERAMAAGGRSAY